MRRTAVGAGCMLVALALVAVQPAWSAAESGGELITFENDPVGGVPDGFTSADSKIALFYDSDGEDLEISDYGVQSHGQAIATYSDDPSFLRIKFLQDVCSISMAFGNDDPGWSQEGDKAKLRVFKEGVRLAQTGVVMNRNDIMDQTISLEGVAFDRAEFVYAVGASPGLIEVVDDIAFTVCA